MTEQEFVQGLFVDKKTFDWGEITTLSFKVEEIVEWLNKNKNDKGYVNVDIKQSKSGKPYAVKNTFVPKAQAESKQDDFSDEIPF